MNAKIWSIEDSEISIFDKYHYKLFIQYHDCNKIKFKRAWLEWRNFGFYKHREKQRQMLVIISKTWIQRINQYNKLWKEIIDIITKQDKFEWKWIEVGKEEINDKIRKNWSIFDDWLNIFEDITSFGIRDEIQLMYSNINLDKLLRSRI